MDSKMVSVLQEKTIDLTISGMKVEVYQISWTMHMAHSYCNINSHGHAEVYITNGNYKK